MDETRNHNGNDARSHPEKLQQDAPGKLLESEGLRPPIYAEEIDLDEEDERILRELWDQKAREEQTEHGKSNENDV